MNEASEHVLNLERVFDAPRRLVFKAWTSREHWMQWWGPKGFKVLECALDFRIGGAWSVAMQSPAGGIGRQRGIFRDIADPERIVFTYAFVDDRGQAGHEMIVSLSFEDLGERTRLILHQAIFESVTWQKEHVAGWGEALDRFEAYLGKI